MSNVYLCQLKKQALGCLPESPAMNFDRSAVSLRLYMEKFPLIMLTNLAGRRMYLKFSLYKSQ